jgi:hypothetical protein
VGSSYFGFKKDAITHPVRTNKIPRQVPSQAWYMHPLFSILIGGILPFGAVFIELFFILTSMWLHQVRPTTSLGHGLALECHSSTRSHTPHPSRPCGCTRFAPPRHSGTALLWDATAPLAHTRPTLSQHGLRAALQQPDVQSPDVEAIPSPPPPPSLLTVRSTD